MALPTPTQANTFLSDLESLYQNLRQLNPYAFNRDFVAWAIVSWFLNSGSGGTGGGTGGGTTAAANTDCLTDTKTNAVATVDLPAVAGKKNIIEGVVTSTSGGTFPAAGMVLTIKRGTTVVCKYTLTDKGVAPVPIPRLQSGTNEAMKIELASGGANVTGEVNVFYRTE